MRIKHLKKKEIFKKENLIPEPTIDVVKSITDIAKFLNPTDDGLFLENGEMKSPNFVRNLKGWKIDSQGNAYFKSITAGSYIQVFVQATVPTSVHINDIWYDSDDNNKMYVAEKAGADQITAGEWVERNNPTEWADVQDGASTKPVNNATVGAVFGTNISGGGAGDGQVSNAGYVGGLGVSKLIAGTILSKAITLAVSAGTGDVKIQAGKTDFGDNTAGFILGIDDSDSDKAKFEIGNSTDYLKWDGSNVKMLCSSANAIHIQYGSDILLEHGGDIKFTSVTAPTACTATLVTTSTGNVDAGTHKYKITYINEVGKTELGIISNTVTTDATHKQVSLTNIPISSSNSVTSRKIYRTKAGDFNYHLLTTINDNTTTIYTDNIADSGLSQYPYNWQQNDSFGKFFVDGEIIFNVSAPNTIIGYKCGYNNAAPDNIFIGYECGYSNIGGPNNVFIGYKCGYSNIDSFDNVFIGNQCGYYNTGNYNVFIGYESGFYKTSGNSNVFIGDHTGYLTGVGAENTFVGGLAGYFTTGSQNTYIGYRAGWYNIAGDYNVNIGYKSGYSADYTWNNIFIGGYAGYYETASNKLFIDNASRTNEADGRLKALIYGVFNATPTSQVLQINAAVICGTNVALATSATDGFLNIPTCAGAPTGTPTTYTGKVAMIYDTTNNKLMVYDGSWIGIALA